MGRKIFIILLCLLWLSLPAGAKLSLSRTEKVQLQFKHSVIKKSVNVAKKSNMKGLQAKLKDEKKAKKKLRSESGI